MNGALRIDALKILLMVLFTRGGGREPIQLLTLRTI